MRTRASCERRRSWKSSSAMSRAASARRVAKARPGCSKCCRGSRLAAACRATSTCCCRSPARSAARCCAPSATSPPAPLSPRSSSTTTNTSGTSPNSAARSTNGEFVTASAPSDTVKLTIDGREVEAPKGMLVIEAAKLIGLDIPVFCYEPRLKPVGACRMCLVQIEKLPRLQTACTTPVAADMVVHTTTPEVIAAQNGVLELLLANHPLDCPICDKGGECPLQDNTFRYGPGASRFTEEKRQNEKAYPLGEQIVLDRERCIMCYRCVRFHQEIPGDEALAAVDRGGDSEIATLSGEPYDSMFSATPLSYVR